MFENTELLKLNQEMNKDIGMPSIEISSQLCQFYSENQALSRSLRELMREENNTRNRMNFVLTEINKLLRQQRNIAPFVNVRNRREKQNEKNIYESSSQLNQFYSENHTLRISLRELMKEEKKTQNRMMFVSTKINNLLRQVLEENDEVKLNKISYVKAIKQVYSTMEKNCETCSEKHNYIDVCNLPGNHEYGTKCFENWFSKGEKTCPECHNPTK
jgi:chromosome segregation ATPase